MITDNVRSSSASDGGSAHALGLTGITPPPRGKKKKDDTMPPIGTATSDDDDFQVEIVDADLNAPEPSEAEREFDAQVAAAKGEPKAGEDTGARPQDPVASAAAPDADELARLREELTRERTARERAEHARGNIESEAITRVVQAEKQRADAQRQAAKDALDTVETRTRAAREALRLAKQTGDHGAEIEAGEALEALKAAKRKIEEQVLPNIPTNEAIDAEAERYRRASQGRQTQQQQSDVAPRNDLASKWSEQNAWMRDPRNASARAVLSEVSAQIHREGIQPSDPAHFVELTKRMGALYPQLGVKGLTAAQPAAPAKTGGSPVASARATVTSRNGKAVHKLDASDLAEMRKFKMDPSNPKHQKAYIRARLEVDGGTNERGRA